MGDRLADLPGVTAKRALVLAGGGVAGIAWETGVLRGIADESPATARALLDFDVLIGTSAGAAVAAQISSGTDLDELFARQVGEESPEIDPGVGVQAVTELFLAALSRPNTSIEQKLQAIGAVALTTDTVPGPVRRDVIAARLPSRHWPDRVLRITAIDTATGKRVVFNRDHGVELIDAVTASCAVPGVWPPVRIGDAYYMDGGIRSSVNLDLAGDCALAVVLSPSAQTAPSPFGGGAAAEVDAFAGRCSPIFADDAALTAFGPDPLKPACRVPAAWAGREQGRRHAAALAAALRT